MNSLRRMTRIFDVVNPVPVLARLTVGVIVSRLSETAQSTLAKLADLQKSFS